MSEVDDAISYVFVWHSLSDACPVCQRLHGIHTFTYKELSQGVLWNPFVGDIYDLNRGVPLTHPNCRCQVEFRETNIDVTTLFSHLRELMVDAISLLRRRLGK